MEGLWCHTYASFAAEFPREDALYAVCLVLTIEVFSIDLLFNFIYFAFTDFFRFSPPVGSNGISESTVSELVQIAQRDPLHDITIQVSFVVCANMKDIRCLDRRMVFSSTLNIVVICP